MDETNFFFNLRFEVISIPDEYGMLSLFKIPVPKEILLQLISNELVWSENDELGNPTFVTGFIDKFILYDLAKKQTKNFLIDFPLHDIISDLAASLYLGKVNRTRVLKDQLGKLSGIFLFNSEYVEDDKYETETLNLKWSYGEELVGASSKLSGKDYGFFSNISKLKEYNNKGEKVIHNFNVEEALDSGIERCISVYDKKTELPKYKFLVTRKFSLIVHLLNSYENDPSILKQYLIRQTDAQEINDLLETDFFFDFQKNKYFFEVFDPTEFLVSVEEVLSVRKVKEVEPLIVPGFKEFVESFTKIEDISIFYNTYLKEDLGLNYEQAIQFINDVEEKFDADLSEFKEIIKEHWEEEYYVRLWDIEATILEQRGAF